MKRQSFIRKLVVSVASVLTLLGFQEGSAFPPAPHHVIFGLVRDEMGDPLAASGAQIYLETSTGVQISGAIVPNLEPGVNYRVTVPMDSGLTVDSYKPTALKPTVPFRIKVQIGTTTYLPLQMQANYANLGQPAASTRIDLTLGEDLDGDGLPDAWERALIAIAGSNLTLFDIRPEDDFDHDGISNYQEYIAGTYAFDPQDGFRLTIKPGTNSVPRLEFLAISSRTYSLVASTNFQSWFPVSFRIPASAAPSAPQSSYAASDVRFVEVEPILPTNTPPKSFFFKALVQ